MTSRFGWLVPVVLCAALLTVAVQSASAQTPSPTATPAPLAPCPTGATLQIAPPTAAAPTTVTTSLTPATLSIKAAAVGDPASLHVHYFVDTPATAAGIAIPSGDAKIIHSGSLTQDLGALAGGQHTVVVVLGQLNHVACETRASVTFAVGAAQASPAAPKTGSAGLAGGSDSAMVTAGLLLLAFGLTVGGRAVSSRR